MDFIQCWEQLQKTVPVLQYFQMDIVWEYRELFINGLKTTLLLSMMAVVLGAMLGLVMGMARLAEGRHGIEKYLIRFFIRWPTTLYLVFFRGTPLFVQILIMHFAVRPVLLNPVDGWLISGDTAAKLIQNYGAFISGLIALTLNSGAYVTEIFRAGIQAIPRGQFEAARSLGMNYWKVMRFIILPQALRRMLPPLGNEAITLLKDSSLVSAIGLTELAYAARTVAGTYSRYWEPYLTISLIYLALTVLMTFGLHLLEKRLNARGG